MGKANPGQHSFAGGELSPLLEGRQDLAKYPIGVRKMQNFLPLIQGPAQKRGGTRFIAEIKDMTARAWLHAFVFSETDAVVLEFGDEYNRFFTGRGVILDGPDPYEIESPYAIADLLHTEGSFNLSIVQSGDVMYLANGKYQPQTLSRTTNIDWAYDDYKPDDGPFDPQNIDKAISVSVDAGSGSVTFTNASSGVPVPIGTTDRLVRIEETDKSAIKPWEASKRIAKETENPFGEVRRSDGKVYSCATNSTVAGGQIEYRTGTVRPVHTEGTEGDGDGEALYSGATLFAGRVGVDWTYLHAGYGIGRITDVDVGGTTADMDVITEFPFPDSVVSPGSYRWSLGAWYTDNFPSSVAFFRSRLCWAYKQRVQLSVSEDYGSHAADEFGETLPDSAIDILISVGKADNVNWMIAQPEALLIGTGGSEVALHEITKAQVFGPANNRFDEQSGYGSRKVAPINVGEYTLFVQTGGRIVREAQYSADSERIVAIDLTSFAEHITQSGLISMVFAKNPNSIVWCVRADGKVAALTYQKEEEVVAWSWHDFGGDVEAAAVIPGAVPGIDDLYLIVKRHIDDNTKRYVEVLLPPYTAPNDPHLACYQDCSLTYDGSVAIVLTPGSGAQVAGSVGVTFTAAGALWTSDDVDREIQQRVYDDDAETWSTYIAVITEYVSNTVVKCTIVSAFPTLDPIAANAWRLTANVLTGFDHLKGETVQITADGATHPDKVVDDDGKIFLDRQAAIAHAGKAVRGVVQLMKLEAGAQDGVAQGKVKRFSAVTFRLFETLGGRVGKDLNSKLDPIQYRRSPDLMNQAIPLYTGDKSVSWPNGYETEGRITFVHDEGLPCTLVAIYPEVMTEDKRSGGSR